MAILDPSTYTPAYLDNPTLDEATLHHIAQYRPDLRGFVLRHPACSPALAHIIQSDGGGTASGPSAPNVPSFPSAQRQFYGGQQPAPYYGLSQPQQPAPVQLSPQAQAWAAWFRQSAGREPGPVDFQGAIASGQLPPHALIGGSPLAPLRPGLQPGLGGLGKAVLLLPVAAVLALIASFLPVASYSFYGQTGTISWYDPGADGPIILGCALIALAIGTLALIKPAKWSYILAGVVSLIAVILPMIGTVGALVNIPGKGLTMGPSAIILLIALIGMVIGAMIVLILSVRVERQRARVAAGW